MPLLQNFQMGQSLQMGQFGQRVQSLKNQLIGQQTGTNIPALANARQRIQSFTGPLSASRPNILSRMNLGQREITVEVPTVLTAGANGGTTAPAATTPLGPEFEIVRG